MMESPKFILIPMLVAKFAAPIMTATKDKTNIRKYVCKYMKPDLGLSKHGCFRLPHDGELVKPECVRLHEVQGACKVARRCLYHAKASNGRRAFSDCGLVKRGR